jgi:hypothetical protein
MEGRAAAGGGEGGCKGGGMEEREARPAKEGGRGQHRREGGGGSPAGPEVGREERRAGTGRWGPAVKGGAATGGGRGRRSGPRPPHGSIRNEPE